MSLISEDQEYDEAVNAYKNEGLPNYHRQGARVQEALRLIDNELASSLDIAVIDRRPQYLLTVKKDGLLSDGSVIERDEHLPNFFRLRPTRTYGTPVIPIPNLLLGISRYSRPTLDGEDVLVTVPIFKGELFKNKIVDDVKETLELVMSKEMFVKMTETVQKVVWGNGEYRNLTDSKYVIGKDVDADFWSESRSKKNAHDIFKVNLKTSKSNACFVANLK